MEINIGYDVIERLINDNSRIHLNTTLVLEIKDEMQRILVESLLWGRKTSLIDAFWIAAKSLGLDLTTNMEV